MDTLRVGVVVNQHYRPESGGGYSYYNILLRHINNFDFPAPIEIHNVVIYNETAPLITLKRPSIFIRGDVNTTWKKFINRRLLKRFGLDYIKQNLIGNYVFSISRGKIERQIENTLRKNKIDLLYYLNPVDKVLNFPFIMTHWDVGHRSTYPFPFLAMHGIYETRENYYTYVLNKALFILCESNAGVRELTHYYQFFTKKIKMLPIFGGLILETNTTAARQSRILEKYGLEPCRFFLYPAQFWPHKNHYNLVKAFDDFQERNTNTSFKLVLCGSDKGNMAYIWEVIKDLKLEQQVILTGFVPDEELHTLYTNATAMVMPTFLGPTNLPLMEAAHLRCPVLCSELDGHKELLGNNALYFDPADSTSITGCMDKIRNDDLRSGLAAGAFSHLQNSPFNVERSLHKLSSILEEAVSIRKTWAS